MDSTLTSSFDSVERIVNLETKPSIDDGANPRNQADEPNGQTSAAVYSINTVDAPALAAKRNGGSSTRSDDDDIRPLTLAPIPFAPPMSGTSDFESFSGSGGAPEDKAPIIRASGEGWIAQQKMANGAPVEGQYEVPNGVPVGAVPNIEVLPPADSGYVIQTITWSGGTDITGYLSTNADQVPPETMSVTTGVQTDQLQYGFVVDAEARLYSVDAQVEYTNGAKGHSTLVFSSVRPTTAQLSRLSEPRPLKLPTQNAISYWDDDEMQPGGMVSQATTQTSSFGGDFMVTQIVQAVRSYTDQNNVAYSMSGGPWIDDGPSGGSLGLGMSNLEPMHSWNVPPNTPGMHHLNIFEDPIHVPSPDQVNDKEITVGIPGEVPTPEMYKTFLMYRPSGGGVWVALAKLEWGWGGALKRNTQSGFWELDESYSQNPPLMSVNPIAHTSDDFWPSWIARSSDMGVWVRSTP
ncbi:MAG: hypothetical protein SFX72_03000 [Isosphaeraceae bacterium]|nr:hypothetical protein [Isosphaeraceae bacterium]